jgi:cytochrome oxidase assembly protein ShyY1
MCSPQQSRSPGQDVRDVTAGGTRVTVSERPVTVGRVRFLFTRRWVLFALAVVVLAYGAYWLGEWQFHRLEDRRERNAQTVQNLDRPPVPVDQVLAAGRPVSFEDEWRQVRATGRYLADRSIIVRYQTRDGASGVDVVTPLDSGAGAPLLLVDRGWVQTGNAGDASPEVPEPPSGQVTVEGWVRADATGDSTVVTDRSTRSISSSAIGDALDAEVYGGFVDVTRESPEPAEPLQHADEPDLSEGPHFFYGLQWWFFGALAVFGFGYLAWDERRKLRAGEPTKERETART